jgi:crotonobetainyl-CoA:carnitine CoA-transferase CaiB-like acyl-CoA transferase
MMISVLSHEGDRAKLSQEDKSLLGVRVLDLCDEKGMYAGQVLGNLGADVIKVEQEGGDPGRLRPPFFHDQPGPLNSLYWTAYNTCKRSITLDIISANGRNQLMALAAGADLVLESFAPGHLDSLGLGHADFERVNPGIVYTSITPFGQSGPHAHLKGSDLICWAAGGLLSESGDPDRPPVRTSHLDLSYLMASMDAAWISLVALWWRNASGWGQKIDLSIQESVLKTCFLVHEYWQATGQERPRGSTFYTIPSTPNRLRTVWPLADGFMYKMFSTSEMSLRENPLIVRWMDQHGASIPRLKAIDWAKLDWRTKSTEEIASIEADIDSFLRSTSKHDLMQEAFRDNIAMQAINSPSDILAHPQLQARQYWQLLKAPFSEEPLAYPSRFCSSSDHHIGLTRRVPAPGEHNDEVLGALSVGRKASTAESPKPSKPSESALAGIKVVTFEHGIMVPMMTSMLADFGATVVRVESAKRPDWQRQAGPFLGGKPDPDLSVAYLFVNSSKLGVSLNLRKPAGQIVARKLVGWADVVTENFAGGVMAKLGLGYEDLVKIKPDIIMLSAGVYGQTGPYAAIKGHGGPLTSLTGLPHLTGFPDQPPQLPGFALTDFTAPRAALLALMAALHHRKRTGKGQYLDLSQFESAVHFMTPVLLEHQVNGREAMRQGNRAWNYAPHGVYPCRGKDRWCAIAVGSEEEWSNLVRLMGNPGWSSLDSFANLPQRLLNQDELDRYMSSWTGNFEAQELIERLNGAGIAAAVVKGGKDIELDPQLAFRGFLQKANQPNWDIPYTYVGIPAVLTRTPAQIRRAPGLGEHTKEVLISFLGLTDAEMTDLSANGVLE